MKKEYSVNEDTGEKYELRTDKYKRFPHLQKLKDEVQNVKYNSKEYWKLESN